MGTGSSAAVRAGRRVGLPNRGRPMTFSIHGLPVARGIAIGRAVLVASSRVDVAHYFIEPTRSRPRSTACAAAATRWPTRSHRLQQRSPMGPRTRRTS